MGNAEMYLIIDHVYIYSSNIIMTTDLLLLWMVLQTFIELCLKGTMVESESYNEIWFYNDMNKLFTIALK